MMDSIETRFGRLDALVLNASGGLEMGADPGYAMRLNRDAQRRLAQLAVPLMPVDGRIVFVTSHQAHFFPNKAVPKGYSAVAASKRAGETALYAMRSVFSRAGVRLTVVSGRHDRRDHHRPASAAPRPRRREGAPRRTARCRRCTSSPEPSSAPSPCRARRASCTSAGADYLMTA